MRTYDVFHHPEDGYETVKRGFSWPAFFFGWLWAVMKDLNFAIFGLLAGSAGLIFINYRFQHSVSPLGALLLSLLPLAFLIWTGCYGNRWRRTNLLKRGFLFVDTVAAKSSKQAIARLSPALTDGKVDA
jgi:hypothetical protein